MNIRNLPKNFLLLQTNGCINESDVINTRDGFWIICKSLSVVLAEKGILDFPDSEGGRLSCDKFFDDWFLYAVDNGDDHVYSLVKMREQEFDSDGSDPADGDTPGVTVAFVAFECELLLNCLEDPTDENRRRLDEEINRVVVYRGQRHNKQLKKYFLAKRPEGAYLLSDLYTDYIAFLAGGLTVNTSVKYKEISRNRSAKLPRFIESLNQKAGYTVCDHEKIYIHYKDALTDWERMAILATHTGNTSSRAFVTELKLHARFLTPLTKVRIPLLGKTLYDSAIRADMTIGSK